MDETTDDDGRAARALADLRRGVTDDWSDEPDGPPGRRWADRLLNLEALSSFDPARPRLLVAAAILAVLVGFGAWFVLDGGASTGGEVSPFAASAATGTTAAADGASGTGPVGAPVASGGPTSTTTVGIVVHAAGAVARPGLQRLAPGARVADLLEAAGGPTTDADLDRLNLAAPLADGQRLYVPRAGESAPAAVGPDGGAASSGGTGGSGTTPASGPVDLNTATADQLDALPGVGPATASAIIDHRERNGSFATVDDLLDVRGIGPAKLEGLRDLVVVG